MQQLVNLCVTPEPGHLFGNWQEAHRFLSQLQLDGFEIGPFGSVSPEPLVSHLSGRGRGLHLSFFPEFYQLWSSARQYHTAGGVERMRRLYQLDTQELLVERYRSQFNLAAEIGADYVVFHPVLCHREGVYRQHFPWRWQDSLRLCAELLNAALENSLFRGHLLFENLWWQESFRLAERQEYDQLRHWVNYDRCGICFDTGHFMAGQADLTDHATGIARAVAHIHQLDLVPEIRVLHLNASLGGAMALPNPNRDVPVGEFWWELEQDLNHISQIDAHQPLCCSADALLETLAPDYVVHELRQSSLSQWRRDILTQQQSLAPLRMAATG